MSFLSSSTPKLAPWKVLLVDDEPDIHDVTKLTLSRFRLDGRALSFVHAYSGAEAKEVLAREQDIALVFLDVVMEQEDSGPSRNTSAMSCSRASTSLASAPL